MVKKILVIVLSVRLLSGPVSICDAKVSGNYKIKRLVSQLYDRRSAIDAQRKLSSYGTEVTEYVLPLLQDKNNESVRIAALRVIAGVGDSSAEDEVVMALKDRNFRVRQEAARTLSVIGQKESSVEPLKKLLNDYQPNVRYNAIKALARIGTKGETDLFISALGDYDPRIRMFAVIALGKLKASKAVPYLSRMVRDIDPGVRLELVKTLGEINTDDCLQSLVWLTGDPDVNIRMLAVENVGRSNAAGAEEALIGAAGSNDSHIASRAILSLAQRKSSDAVKIARENLNDEHMVVKLAAIEVLGKMGGKDEKTLLEPLLSAESTLVRKKAQEALAGVNSRT